MSKEKMKQLRKRYEELHERYLDCLIEGKLDEARKLERVIDEIESFKRRNKVSTNEKLEIIDTATKVLGVVLPTITTVYFMKKGFEFETTGVYKSKTFGQLFKKV